MPSLTDFFRVTGYCFLALLGGGFEDDDTDAFEFKAAENDLGPLYNDHTMEWDIDTPTLKPLKW